MCFFFFFCAHCMYTRKVPVKCFDFKKKIHFYVDNFVPLVICARNFSIKPKKKKCRKTLGRLWTFEFPRVIYRRFQTSNTNTILFHPPQWPCTVPDRRFYKYLCDLSGVRTHAFDFNCFSTNISISELNSFSGVCTKYALFKLAYNSIQIRLILRNFNLQHNGKSDKSVRQGIT